MTKQELMRLFPRLSPTSAFRDFGDGYEVTGKWVRIAFMRVHPLIAERSEARDTWDVWLCDVRGGVLSKGIGTGKLNNLLAVTPEGITPRVLDGEAFWQCRDAALLRAWLETHRVALGIKKRRTATSGGFPKASGSFEKPGPVAVPEEDGADQYQGSGSELSTGENRSQSHLRKTPYPGPHARKGEPPAAKPLTPAEAREMDALLSQQAMDRIRERGWSYAGPNKVLGKLAALEET